MGFKPWGWQGHSLHQQSCRSCAPAHVCTLLIRNPAHPQPRPPPLRTPPHSPSQCRTAGCQWRTWRHSGRAWTPRASPGCACSSSPRSRRDLAVISPRCCRDLAGLAGRPSRTRARRGPTCTRTSGLATNACVRACVRACVQECYARSCSAAAGARARPPTAPLPDRHPGAAAVCGQPAAKARGVQGDAAHGGQPAPALALMFVCTRPAQQGSPPHIGACCQPGRVVRKGVRRARSAARRGWPWSRDAWALGCRVL